MKNTLYRNSTPLLIIVAMLLSLFTGCSEKNEVKLNPNSPVTIVIWHYYHGAQKSAFDSAVKEFNDTVGYEKGIIVESVSHGGVDELASNVMAAAKGELDAGSMPDIFGSHGDTALEILNMGLVAEIDPYLPVEKLAEYEDSFIQEGRIDKDKLYVFPIAKSTESLMLNKTDFDVFVEGLKASGLNESVSYDDLSTWEGILRVSDVYYRYTQSLDPAGEGKAFFGLDSLANYLIIGSKQLGQDLVSVENGKATINLDKEIMSKLWYTYYEPMVTGRFTKLGRFCSDDIKTGDSLCFVGSTTSASYFPSELVLDGEQPRSIEMVALPMPVFENGDKISVSQGAGMVVAKSTKEKEYASVLFLEWFTEIERNVPFSLNSSYLPVKKAALDENILNEAFDKINNGDIGMSNSIKSLRVGIEQMRSYTLYSSEVFNGGAEFRSNLPDALLDAASSDRASYLELVEGGSSPEQAYAEIYDLSRGKFENWIISLSV